MNDSKFAAALALQEAGRVTEAAALYRTILEREPNHADSLHLLGLIIAEQSDPETGMAMIRRAMAIQPGRAVYHHSLALGYHRLERMADAVSEYRSAAALLPNAPEIHSNLATALRALGQHREAIDHYRQATALAPGNPDTWYNLANMLAGSDPSAEAGMCFRKAIELKPDFVHALANYGCWLIKHGSWADAQDSLSRAVRLAPRYGPGWNQLGVALHEQCLILAEDCYRIAIDIDPGMAGAHYNLGRWLFDQGRTGEAVTSHAAAIEADPGFAPARLATCMGLLPILYRTQDEVAECRTRYATALDALGTADARSLADALGQSQPFFLPYQGENDRALQSTYGELACRALAEIEPPAHPATRPAPGERIRLGIVSGFFCDHTLFKLFLEGWLTQLDRSRFEVIGFHTGRVTDSQTMRSASLCDRFVQGLPSGAAWREAISATAPHVLLYPEVGIDPIAGRLAAMRLAPLQCVTWGHPETTGMPTIDYFLSSDLMEPPNGDRHYTERLVRLPNLGTGYTPDASASPDIDRAERARLGLDPEATVFWSGQALYKYLPRYDAIFPRIAAELGACQFVFIAFAKSQSVTNAFRDRLGTAFAAVGLDASQHVVILPPMAQHDYLGAVGLADVILDTPGWSGGKSTLDCLAQNPAIVTWPGRFMRGRHTAAILRRIGCEETIATSMDDYVSIAVRLARDPGWRAEIRQAVARGKHRAFDDLVYARALETFLADTVTMPG